MKVEAIGELPAVLVGAVAGHGAKKCVEAMEREGVMLVRKDHWQKLVDALREIRDGSSNLHVEGEPGRWLDRETGKECEPDHPRAEFEPYELAEQNTWLNTVGFMAATALKDVGEK